MGAIRHRPITIYALGATINSLKKNLFNWEIWPDFTTIPSLEKPWLRYQEITVGEVVTLNDRKITALPAVHTVPAVGYQLDSGRASLVFSGDTGPNDDLWVAVNQITNLRFVIIETAFSNKDQALATASQHLCPATLGIELAKLKQPAEIYITHLKPIEVELTMLEIEELSTTTPPRLLENNQLFEF